MDELSKRRLYLLGYELYKKCSLGEAVSNKDLSERLCKVNMRYPSLTLNELIGECKLKDKPDKFTKASTESLKILDIIREDEGISDDVLENILLDYIEPEFKRIYKDKKKLYFYRNIQL